MIRTIHRRLTLLCSGITITILTTLSVCCLAISEANLRENSFLSFRNDMNTLLSNLEHQTVFTHEWLSKIEGNSNYIISIRDNGKEFLWGTQRELTDSAWEHYQSAYPQPTAVSTGFSIFDSFPGYYGCIAVSVRPNGILSILILKPLDKLEQQLLEQRILFFSLIVAGNILLFLFSRYFTGKLLEPIEQNRQNQLAFVASASHELRTPLSVILSAADACQRAVPSEQKHFFSIMRKEGESMSRLISDLLLLAETEQGTAAFCIREKALCDPDTLLLTVYETYEIQAQKTGHHLSVLLPEYPTCAVSCDENRIRQVFSVLLQNAFGHTPPGTRIRITLEQNDRSTVFMISDNGPGIPDDQKGKIFDRFYRGDLSRQQNGHFGLGLSIASEIIKAHGGELYIKDTASSFSQTADCLNHSQQTPSGATFCFTLPL